MNPSTIVRTGASKRLAKNKARRSGKKTPEERQQEKALAKEAKAKAPTATEKLLEQYKLFAYSIIGRRLDKVHDKRLGARLKQADYNVTPGMYHALKFTTAGIAAIVGLVLGVLTLSSVLGAMALAGGVAVAALGAVGAFVAFPATLSARISNRSAELDKELPFSLSELSVLASIGLSPIQMCRKMAQRKHDLAMTNMFRKVVTKADLQGQDLVQALTDTARDTPSKALRETLWDVASMIHQGSDLGEYLATRSAEVLELRRAEQVQFIDRLGVYADMYITVVLMGVLFLGIGAFMMDAFGRTAGGLTAEHILQLLTFGFAPGVVIFLGVLLAGAYGKVQG